MIPIIIMFSPSGDGLYEIYRDGNRYSLVYIRPYEESHPILMGVTFEKCMKEIGNIIKNGGKR